MSEAKRIIDDEYHGGGCVKLSDLDGLNEYEKLAAKVFEEGIENSFKHMPPILDLQPNANNTDLIATVHLPALGSDYEGPAWQFSTRELFQLTIKDMSTDDKASFIKTLMALADAVRKIAPDRP